MKTLEIIDPACKRLADDISSLYNNFIQELKLGVLNPVQLAEKYNQYFEECNSLFKKNVLKSEKSKFGLFLYQYKNYHLSDYIREKFSFTSSKQNRRVSYTQDKLYNIVLFEVFLLYQRYNFLYPFMIQYAILQVFTTYFTLFIKDESVKGWAPLYMPDDLETTYNQIIDTDENDIPGFTVDLDKAIFFKAQEHQAQKNDIIRKRKPESKEEILTLFDGKGELKQKEKYSIVAAYYGISERSARRIMNRYGLCEVSNKDKKGVADDEKAKLLARIEYLENELKQAQEKIRQLQGGMFGGIDNLSL